VVVTALRPDARSPGCLVVEVDGGRVASLPAEVVRELGLAPGEELAPSRYQALLAAARVESARRVALRLLGARPRAVEDLRRRLRDRGHDPDAVRVVLDRLQSAGLLNDEEFARHYARVRAPKGHGPARLIHDLMGHGVSRSVAERATAEVAEAEGVNPVEQARALAERRAGQLRTLPRDTRLRRLLSFLARRGFRGREVRELAERLVGN
jgi:regulatory protein